MQAVKYAPDFNGSQSPSADLSTPGPQTVNLAACPAGVSGSEPQYYVYLAGASTAEPVLVTGGTCAGDGQAGSLQFTTANAHTAGYSIGSASGGLQEALVATRYAPTNPTGTSQSGKVIVPPGEFKALARVSIRASNIVVDFSGSIVECWMNDSCIFVGDTSSSTLFSDITLINPRGRPTITNGQKPFIEVNAQKTRLFNVSTRVALSNGTFSSYVQVDDDQGLLAGRTGYFAWWRKRELWRSLRCDRVQSGRLRTWTVQHLLRRRLAEEFEHFAAVSRQWNRLAKWQLGADFRQRNPGIRPIWGARRHQTRRIRWNSIDERLPGSGKLREPPRANWASRGDLAGEFGELAGRHRNWRGRSAICEHRHHGVPTLTRRATLHLWSLQPSLCRQGVE